MHSLRSDDFIAASLPVLLADDEIHLWFFPQCNILPTGKPDHTGCLLRVLSSYTACDAEQLRFERNAYGKPSLVGMPGDALKFNASHSGQALLIGLSKNQNLGVDLEIPTRQRPLLEIAQRYFSGDEIKALEALPEPQQTAAFLNLWTCKEAVLKALGRGIAFGLERLSFTLAADGGVDHLAHIDIEAGASAHWQVLSLYPEESAFGALAWCGAPLSIRAFRAT